MLRSSGSSKYDRELRRRLSFPLRGPSRARTGRGRHRTRNQRRSRRSSTVAGRDDRPATDSDRKECRGVLYKTIGHHSGNQCRSSSGCVRSRDRAGGLTTRRPAMRPVQTQAVDR